ncbi:transglycosylase SLT domain-containing protein [Comamonas endophytica]
MTGLELLAACAPNVAPATIQKIIHVESRGNPIAVNANDRVVAGKDGTKTRVRFKAPIPIQSAQDAVTVAYAAIEAGHSVDLGYMQVNSRNLPALGMSVEEMLSDGCKNVAAGAQVLAAFYASALPRFGSEQAPCGPPCLPTTPAISTGAFLTAMSRDTA